MSGYLIIMISSMVCRTILSIFVATINGNGAQAVVDRDLTAFLKNMVKLAILAIPASVCNSMLAYMNKLIGFEIRDKLVCHFQDKYLAGLTFYQLKNLDSRIENPDQRFTEDIKKFSLSLSDAFMNLVKPSLDLVLFTKSLTAKLGIGMLGLNFLWYGVSGVFIRLISPPMGLLTSVHQNLEGEYRSQHGYIKTNVQEICLLRGTRWEKQQLKTRFGELYNHSKMLLKKRLFLGTFDNILTKYGATIMGYFVLSRPAMAIAKNREAGVSIKESSVITREYMRNGSLMINLAKSIGRIVITYKDLQKIAGFTVLITQMNEVLNDLHKGRFFRRHVRDENHSKAVTTRNLQGSGKLKETDNEIIEFKGVPLETPNGNLLVESLTLSLKRGQNLIVTGPNGIGKSSLFRVLGGLWPLVSGKLERPYISDLFYLPQKPYLSEGTLEQQIIYPHMNRNLNVSEEKILEILEFVECTNLLKGKGIRGLQITEVWNHQLGQGEKQRIAMARMIYHRPKFAILDECTSTVSSQMEADFYNKCRELGISLFTISHRVSLFKYHELHLRIEKDGAKLSEIVHSKEEVSAEPVDEKQDDLDETKPEPHNALDQSQQLNTDTTSQN